MTQTTTERNSTTNATDSHNGRDHKLSLIDPSDEQREVMKDIKALHTRYDYPSNLIGAFAPDRPGKYQALNLIFQGNTTAKTLSHIEEAVTRLMGDDNPVIKVLPCKDSDQLSVKVTWNSEEDEK